MRKVSVVAITVTYLDMTFATTANITSVVETGGYFVRTVICTIIWASFPMSHVNDMKGEPMNDLISRQAALEVIGAVFPVDPMKSEYAQGIACGAALAKTYVEQLPSAQPEIIRCKDCKHKHIEKAVWVCPFGLPGGPEFFCGYGSERQEE